MSPYDLAVIGSGPGGYVAAIRAAQLGLKTAIIECYETLGGTCLNVGCIPSKALLDSTEHLHQAKTTFVEHGITIKGLSVDFAAMVQRKRDVVKTTSDGIKFLMKKHKIAVISGHASFIDKQRLSVKKVNEQIEELSAEKIVIATGSKPMTLPGIEIDKRRIISSTEALELREIPKSMVIIGGGVIGLELGSVFARLGTEIKVVEFLDRIVSMFDGALSKELQRVLKKLGFEFYLSHKVTGVKSDKQGVRVTAQNSKDAIIELSGELCLVSVGRRPYTDQLGLEKIGVKLDAKGRVEVDATLQTTVAGIYAIGDVIQGAMLAHKAEEEGIFVAETIVGQKPHINYRLIPNVVYTWPEVASVGFSEEELVASGRAYKSGSFPFKASGRARAAHDTDGLIKVLADQKTDELLGVHMIGPRAADMIAEAVVAMEYRAAAEDIARISHAHPTFSEAFKEACLAATDNRAIHI